MRIFRKRQQLQYFIDICADPELRLLQQQRLHELAGYELHELAYFYSDDYPNVSLAWEST
jgi:hypothetical protein